MKAIAPFLARALLPLAALLPAVPAHAQVTVSDPWVRATVAQQKSTGAFMKLQAAKDTTLISATSPLTPTVEVHEMRLQGDVMRMREVPSISLSAGQAVELRPGGYHIMLLNLQHQVKEGETVPLTLVFEGSDGARETVAVNAPVRALAAGPAADQGSHAGGSAPPAHGSHGEAGAGAKKSNDHRN